MNLNKKHILIIIIIMLLVLSPVTARGYHIRKSVITHVDSYVSIDEDNYLDVSQCFHCQFIDENEITLSVPFDKNQTVCNLEVDVPGYYKQVDIYTGQHDYKIRIHLYEDENHYNVTRKKNVDINVRYLIRDAITAYDDVAVVDYTLWDSNINVRSYSSMFTLPYGEDNITVYIYPDGSIDSKEWINNDTYRVNFVPFYKVKEEILIPRDSLNNTSNVKLIHQNAADMYKQKHDNYISHDMEIEHNKESFKQLLILLIAIPFIARILLFQRGNSDAIRNEPNLKAIDVNYLFYKNIGTINLGGFYALFLGLIRRNAFNCSYDSDDATLKLNTDMYDKLNGYERVVFDYIRYMIEHPPSGIDPMGLNSRYTKFKLKRKYHKNIITREDITFHEINHQLEYGGKRDEYIIRLQEEYAKDTDIDIARYYNNTTYRIMNIYLKAVLTLSILGYFIINRLISTNLYNIPLVDVKSLLVVIILIYAYWLIRKNMVYGRWTSYGLNEYSAWIKYTTKHIRLKKHKEDEKVDLDELNCYIEYALALGRINMQGFKDYLVDEGYVLADFENRKVLEFVYANSSIEFEDESYEPTLKSKFIRFMISIFNRN